jgi:TRAP-type mannitol/chloroaromatic compound transport system permease small subunit
LILSFVVFGLVTVYGFAGTWRSWKVGETMVNIALPMWPGKACVVVGGVLLCLQMMARMVRLLRGSEEA